MQIKSFIRKTFIWVLILQHIHLYVFAAHADTYGITIEKNEINRRSNILWLTQGDKKQKYSINFADKLIELKEGSHLPFKLSWTGRLGDQLSITSTTGPKLHCLVKEE